MEKEKNPPKPKKHMKEALRRVKEALLTSDLVAVEMATGTGKSYIIMEIVKANPQKQFLLLTSSSHLRDREDERMCEAGQKKHITCGSYPGYDGRDMKELDFLIVDEYHRLGAPSYMQTYKNILNNNPGIKVLGLSATPVRSDGRDMCAEIFHGNCVYSLDLQTAIRRRILPRPIYYACAYENEDLRRIIDELGKVKDLSMRNFLARARRMLENSMGLKEVFQKAIPTGSGKYMVFCRDNAHIDLMQEKCREWFDWVTELRFYEQTSQRNRLETNYKEFQKDHSGALCLFFCVDQFNEGTHECRLDGLIFLRPTASHIIFQQQYGRVMDTNDMREVTVIDVVNNYKSVCYFAGIIRAGNGNKRIPGKYEGEFEITGEKKAVGRLLREIKKKQEVFLEWNRVYRLAELYYDRHGNINVPRHYIMQGVDLYNWLNEQREYYWNKSRRKLEYWQIRRLNELEMDWDPANGIWLEDWEIVRDYAKENDITQLCEKTNPNYGLNIYRWVQKQRALFRKGALSERQIILLRQIGIRLESDAEIRWMENYEKVKKYLEENGGLEGLDQYDPLLYRWLRRQIALYRGEDRGRLGDRQKKLLKELDIDLNTRKFKVERDLCLLETYAETHHRLPQKTDAAYYEIRVRLEKKLNTGGLATEQEYRLINLGIRKVFKKSRKRYSLKQKMESISAFCERYPEKKISRSMEYEGIPIGEILHNLNNAYRRGKISAEDRRLLEKALPQFFEGGKGNAKT